MKAPTVKGYAGLKDSPTRVHDEIPVLGGQHLAADHVLGHGDRLAIARAQLSQVLDVLRPPMRPQQPDERADFLQGYITVPLFTRSCAGSCLRLSPFIKIVKKARRYHGRDAELTIPHLGLDGGHPLQHNQTQRTPWP
jgi:hypothetical protein